MDLHILSRKQLHIFFFCQNLAFGIFGPENDVDIPMKKYTYEKHKYEK